MLIDSAQLSALSIHGIGNRTLEKPLVISQDPVDINDSDMKNTLTEWMLSHFKLQIFHNFTYGSDDLEKHPVYSAVATIFNNPTVLHHFSAEIARHLFDKTGHPNIKDGYLYVAYFQDVVVEDEMMDAIGIFKTEGDDEFISTNKTETGYVLSSDQGTYTGRLDKGCLVLNTDKENGYRVLVIDKVLPNGEAKFWKEKFLRVTEAQDDYYHTRQVMDMTKSFVESQLPLELTVDRPDQIDLMNKSIEYFKSVPHYSEREFADEVFGDMDVTDAFSSFRSEYERANETEISTDLELNSNAVKKNARIFKSVIKLDRNFHIYIHGDRSQVEKGVDEHGRKYYCLYYDEEH